MFEHGGHAELHRLVIVLREQAPLQLREQLPRCVTQELLEGLPRDAQRRLVGVHVAVLPVQGEEGLVDLLEHGARAGVAMPDTARGARLAQAALQRRGFATGLGPPRHAHLEAAVES